MPLTKGSDRNQKLETKNNYSLEDTANLLERVAQQISNDRKDMERSLLQHRFDFEKRISESCSSFKSFILTSIDEKFSAQSKEMDDLLKNLQIAENNLSELKNRLDISNEFFRRNVDKQKDIDSGMLNSILAEFKEDLKKIIMSENRSREKEIFEAISKFLEHTNEEHHKEMMLFCSDFDSKESFDERNSKPFLLDRLEILKKNLITKHNFLMEQNSEVEKIRKIVEYFNLRLIHFSVIFDKFWKQNNVAIRQLKEDEVVWSSLLEEMDISATFLLQQSKIFVTLIADVMSVLKPVSEQLKEREFQVTIDADMTWINNIDTLSQKLENLLYIGENCKENLESLTRTSKNLGTFHSLMKSITSGYNTLLKFFLLLQGRSQIICSDQETKSKLNEEGNQINIESCNASIDFRRLIEKNKNCIDDAIAWDEFRNTLKIKFPNVNMDQMIPFLKDIVKTAWELYGEKEISSQDVGGPSKDRIEESQPWGNFPSESLLTETSSECLIHDSDESCGTSEIDLLK